MNEDDLKLIEKYYEGQLSQDELDKFEERLENDQVFKHLFEIQKVLNGQAVADVKLKEKIENIDYSSESNSNKSNMLKWAASIAILIIAGYLWWTSLNQSLSLGSYAVIEIEQRDHGFTELKTPNPDSIYVKIIEDKTKGYQFSEKQLTLYWETDTIQLKKIYYDPEENSYWLLTISDTFRIQHGFDQRLPLELINKD